MFTHPDPAVLADDHVPEPGPLLFEPYRVPRRGELTGRAVVPD